MISISQSTPHKIIFSPRKGFSSIVPQLEFPVIYAHVCPTCNNVIQALYKTPKPIDLWPYEETAVLSRGQKNAGELLKIVPGTKDSYGTTLYNRTYFNGSEPCQKISLKNHIFKFLSINYRLIGDTANMLEKGPKPCPFIGIFSLNPSLTVKDYCLFYDMSVMELDAYNIPRPEEFVPKGGSDYIGKLLPSVGEKDVPMILVKIDDVYGGHNCELRPRLDALFLKPGNPK